MNRTTALAVVSAATLTACFGQLQGPGLTKTFGEVSIGPGSTTALKFTLSNPNPVPLTGLAFLDALPAGLVVASPNGLTGSCGGGTITAAAGGSTISLAGATLAAGASCTFSLNVTADGTVLACSRTKALPSRRIRPLRGSRQRPASSSAILSS